MEPSQIQHRFLRRVELLQCKSKHTPTYISLFSGCGGMDWGFRQAGFEIRVMVEWDKAACDTLCLNWTMDGIRRAHSGHIPEWYQEREPAILERDITTSPTSEILEAAGLQVGVTLVGAIGIAESSRPDQDVLCCRAAMAVWENHGH